MTFRPHVWIVGALASTCVHCETLRVRDAGGSRFIKRAACSCPPGGCLDGCPRLFAAEPECVAPNAVQRLRQIDVWPRSVARAPAPPPPVEPPPVEPAAQLKLSW